MAWWLEMGSGHGLLVNRWLGACDKVTMLTGTYCNFDNVTRRRLVFLGVVIKPKALNALGMSQNWPRKRRLHASAAAVKRFPLMAYFIPVRPRIT